MSFFGFTTEESVPYLAMLILSLVVLIMNYKKGFRDVWSPVNIVVVIFAYYCLLGPFQAVSIGKTSDRLINMRPYYVSAFWGAFISVSCIIIGFALNNRKGKLLKASIFSDDLLLEYGKKLTLVGFILFTISTRGQVANLINPFDAVLVESVGGSFANYLSLSLNFMIPGVTLLFTYFIKTKKGLLWFVISFVVALGLFTSLGFRFRIVLMLVSIGISYYMVKRTRPNLLIIVPALFIFISLMGLIAKTRNYGRGLDLNVAPNSNKSYYAYGLEEALIFQTSGAIIDLTGSKIPYAGFTPIISTILFPVPHAIYSEKNSADYVFNALDAIYGHVNSKGAAFMMYAEYYLAFGWFGIAIGSFLLGWFYKRLWSWFLVNQQNPFAIVAYAVTVSFLYVIISRGYLPQVTMLFFFSVAPIYFALWRIKKNNKVTNFVTRPVRLDLVK